jgi:hypothetical protein
LPEVEAAVHDFHRNTAEALPELIHQLKAGGYKVVQLCKQVASLLHRKQSPAIPRSGACLIATDIDSRDFKMHKPEEVMR